MDELNPQEIDARARRWSEQLAENEALRDSLEDHEATQLLNWGFAQLKQASIRASFEEAPDEYMEDAALAVMRVLRQVNGLVPTMAYLVEDEIAEEMADSFIGSVMEVTGYDLGTPWGEDLVETRGTLHEAAMFQYFMDALNESA